MEKSCDANVTSIEFNTMNSDDCFLKYKRKRMIKVAVVGMSSQWLLIWVYRGCPKKL